MRGACFQERVQTCPRAGCGHRNRGEARFCARCGQRLRAEATLRETSGRDAGAGAALLSMFVSCALIAAGAFLLFGGMPALGIGLFGVTLLVTGGSCCDRTSDDRSV
jgi:hypothetical protein